MTDQDPRIPLLPDPVVADENAVCVLSAWVASPGEKLHVMINPAWEDPGTWGIALIDIARHVARAYADKDGVEEETVLERVKELIEAEFESQTATVTGGPVSTC